VSQGAIEECKKEKARKYLIQVLPFHFNDICNRHELASGCDYCKVSEIEVLSPFLN